MTKVRKRVAQNVVRKFKLVSHLRRTFAGLISLCKILRECKNFMPLAISSAIRMKKSFGKFEYFLESPKIDPKSPDISLMVSISHISVINTKPKRILPKLQ